MKWQLKPVCEVAFVKIAAYKQNRKSRNVDFQGVIDQAEHTFQWSQGTANCSCGRWTLRGTSLE